MNALRAFLVRLLAIGRSRQLDRQLHDELDAHLQLATDDYIQRGLTPEDARQAAVRHLGGMTQITEAYRERRGLPRLETVWQDLSYAWRGFRRTPGFTLVALATLTLATASTLAIVSLLNALVFRELPVREPRTLVKVMTRLPADGESQYGLPWRAFLELGRAQSVFSTVMGSVGIRDVTVEIDGTATRGTVWGVTVNTFDELGVQPALGRLLGEADEDLDALTTTPVAVLGFRYWQHRFAGGPVVGRQIVIDGAAFTIVGVAPETYTGLSLTIEPQITIPLLARARWLDGQSPSDLLNSPARSVDLIARLEPGTSIDAARAQLDSLWPSVRQETIPADVGPARRAEMLATQLRIDSFSRGNPYGMGARFVQPLWILLTLAGGLLLVAGANLAGLALARAESRRHEMGVRVALGAGRGRLLQQGLTEGWLLSSVGTAAGLMAGYWAARHLSGEMMSRAVVVAALDVTPDARVIAVAVLAAIVIGAVIGVVPLQPWHYARASRLLGHGARIVRGGGRFGPWLVGTQVALSLALLLQAGLLIRTVEAIVAIDPGYQTAGVWYVRPEPRPLAYPPAVDDTYYPELVARLRALPSVHAVGITQAGIARTFDWREPVADAATHADGPEAMAAFAPMSPGLLDTLRIPLLSGRDFSWTDHSQSQPVAILSRSLAQRLFPDGTALGQYVRVGGRDHRQQLEVVGIAEDARLYNRKNPDTLAVYVPSLQEVAMAKWKGLYIRADRLSVAGLNDAVAALGREYVVIVEPLSEIANHAILHERLTARLASFFGGLTLLLSAIGLYGLISYGVKQRHQEFAVRLAFGAQPWRLVQAVTFTGITITLAGAGAGLVMGVLATGFVRSLIFGVSTYDLWTLAGAPLILLATAFIACLLPAARAARVQPTIALRGD